jgi:hypothetical protein
MAFLSPKLTVQANTVAWDSQRPSMTPKWYFGLFGAPNASGLRNPVPERPNRFRSGQTGYGTFDVGSEWFFFFLNFRADCSATFSSGNSGTGTFGSGVAGTFGSGVAGTFGSGVAGTGTFGSGVAGTESRRTASS